MGIFRFKKFEVRNEKSAMKVNTDGVLLGALMTVSGNDHRLLDIGTGTGTIALMAAQRIAGNPESEDNPESAGAPASANNPDFLIDAIDIDGASAEEAGANFRNSPWAGHLQAHLCPLSQFRPAAEYDRIFSNPPFFTETLHSPSARKAQARHADSLPTEEIMDFAAARLCQSGTLSLILPAEHEAETARIAAEHGLHLFRAVRIQSSDRKKPYRAVMEFARNAGEIAGSAAGKNPKPSAGPIDRDEQTKIAEPVQETVTININGKYSEQYLDIVSDFLLLGRT